MNSEKLHRRLIGISFLIIAFMYADTYLAPARWNREQIIRKVWVAAASSRRARSRSAPTFRLFTDHHRYYVSKEFYDGLNVGDIISVDRSFISHSLKGIRFQRDEYIYQEDLGFISSGAGTFFTAFFGIVSALMYLFYPGMSYPAGRTNLSFFLLGISVFLFIFYFTNGF